MKRDIFNFTERRPIAKSDAITALLEIAAPKKTSDLNVEVETSKAKVSLKAPDTAPNRVMIASWGCTAIFAGAAMATKDKGLKTTFTLAALVSGAYGMYKAGQEN